MPRPLTYDIAIKLLRRSDCVLSKTFVTTKRGVEFSIISKNGGPSGPVTEATAARLLATRDAMLAIRDCSPAPSKLFISFKPQETRHRGLEPKQVAGEVTSNIRRPTMAKEIDSMKEETISALSIPEPAKANGGLPP